MAFRRIFVFFLLLFSFLVVPMVVHPSYASAATEANCRGESGSFLKFPTWYKYLDHTFVPAADGNPAECKLDFDFTTDIGKILLAVVEILLRIGGMVAVAFVIYGGILYILSEGKPDKYGAALTTIINAAIGLAIAASATVIVNLIGNTLIK